MLNQFRSCHYFVDEAGDPTLFDKKGKVLIGSPGCSRYFILGLLRVDEPDSLENEMDDLRAKLITDPYFSGVPSLRPENMKTAVAFHATDDIPEVRKEVFSLLMRRKDLRFFAVIRAKQDLLLFIRQRNSMDPGYHYDPNEVYDYLVRRLFRDRLHKSDRYQIFFARRGSSDRTSALKSALQAAKERHAEKYNKQAGEAAMEVIPVFSKQKSALQAVDYFLWALQRLYERGEDRYVSLLWPSFRLVVDMDDTHSANYGMYYDQRHPLNLDAIKGRHKEQTTI